MMKKTRLSLAGAVVAMSLSSFAQPVGQWDFNSGTLAPTVGTLPLTYLDANSQTGVSFGTTTALAIPGIGGAPAAVAKINGFTAPSGLGMPVASDANGGGSLVNQWTWVADVLFPASSAGKIRALLDVDGGTISKDAELFVNSQNGIGIGGGYSGNVTSDAWHRIAVVFDGGANQMRKFIDGTLVGIQDYGAAPAGGLDGRWTLAPQGVANLFTDDNGEVAPVYVNSIQLWNRTLSAGEVAALAMPEAAGIPGTIGSVPAFIESSTPTLGQTGVSFQPDIDVVLNSGDSTVTPASVKLLLDGAPVDATVAQNDKQFTLDFSVTDFLEPNATHTVGVVYNENGTLKTNSFSFVVQNYQKLTLPEPFLVENFDAVEEGSIPDGWSRTNHTDIVTNHDFLNLDDLKSDSYLDWLVVSTSRVIGLKGRIGNIGTIVLNGEPVEALSEGNMLYQESDVRSGNQVQVVFTKDYDFTGKSNVFAAFNSLYEQNQDNIASFEYSTNGGATWLPGIYMLNQFQENSNLPVSQGDVYFNADTTIDAVTTLNTPHSEAAFGTSYGAYIGAPITADLAPYISGRGNDDTRESKRIEVIRLFGADNQPAVRFRFMQAGTGSWYWGVDDFGFYTIPEARVVFSPASMVVSYAATANFKVTASGTGPLTYQWYHDGAPISGATSATLAVTNANADSQGKYYATVHNSLGDATSQAAVLTVILAPQIMAQPQPIVATEGAPFSLSVAARGQTPFTYQWSKDGAPISGATSDTYTIASSVVTNSGVYSVKISNASGTATSTDTQVTIYPLMPITQDLVLHLPFDTDSNDTSGRSNNGTPEVQPEITDGTLPTYDTAVKRIGGGSIHITDGQDIAFGAPEDLLFGADVNFTVSFWVRGADANAWTEDPSFFGNKNWDSGGNPGYVIAGQGSGSWKWNWKGGSAGRRDVGGFPSVTDGAWHNVIVAHDRTGLAYFYVDGVLRNSVTIAGDGDVDVGTSELMKGIFIGQDGTGRYGFDRDTGAHFKNIWMDDFGVWRRLLTPQEAASVYSHGANGEDLTHASGEVVILPPNITTPPQSAIVVAGGTVTLSVTVAGTAPFTYQWNKNGQPLSGETGAMLLLSSIDANAVGNYTVTVSNSKGSPTSAAASIQVSSGNLADGLVAHISFDGNYNDTSGRNNNATPRGNPVLVAGKFGQAMQFHTEPGIPASYASFGKPADLNFGDASDFTISMWVNWTASIDDLPFISNKDWNSSNNTGWGLFSQGGGNLRIQATGTPSGSANKVSSSSTPNIRDGNWHNVVTTFWRGHVAATYVDGALVNSLPMTITGSIDAGLETNIGQDGTGIYTDGTAADSVHMTGNVDDVAIWRRALSGQEAARIASAAGDLGTLVPSQLKITGATIANGQLHLTVTGLGSGAKLQRRATFDAGTDWQDVGPITGNTDVAVTGTTGFFRVVNP